MVEINEEQPTTKEIKKEQSAAKPIQKVTTTDRCPNVKLRLTRMSKAVREELKWNKSTSAMDVVGKDIQRDRKCAGSHYMLNI